MKDKTLKISLLLVVAFLCCTIVSCSNDDDDNSGIVGSGTTEKKLVQTRDNWCVRNISYDNSGRVVSIIDPEDYAYMYTWSDNWVVEDICDAYNNIYDDSWENIYYFTNGVISSYVDNSGEKAYYEYDSYKHLTSVTGISRNGDPEYTSTLTWNDGKLTKITCETSSGRSSSLTFTYSGQSCNGYLPLYVFWNTVWLDEYIFCDDDVACFVYTTNPELIGLKLTQLPSSVNGVPFEYELDSDNYVISCVTDSESYTFLWE